MFTNEEINLTNGLNEFTWNLCNHLSKGNNNNTFVSPFNAACCLAMVYGAASGKTKEEMQKVFGFPDVSPRAINELFAEIESILEDGTVTTANSVWCSKKLELRESYAQLVKEIRKSVLATVDFSNPQTVNEINGWVQSKTNDKIVNLLAEIDKSTEVILVSAIHFLGKWGFPFKVWETQEADFFGEDGITRKVQMMFHQDKYSYCTTPEYAAISIPYEKGKYNMNIVMPHKKMEISCKTYNEALWKMCRREVMLYLPKWKITSSYELKKPLMELGMQSAFSDDAQFPEMSHIPLKISDVIHQAFVDVNEEGTEAAAATAVTMVRCCNFAGQMDFPVVFRADKPFYYAIQHAVSGIVVFAGYNRGLGE